jgi:hypothetical protein
MDTLSQRVASRFASDQWIPIRDVARKFNEQAQYVARWLRDPELAEGVRWEGNPSSYHSIRFHKDDVDAWVDKIQKWRKETGQIR